MAYSQVLTTCVTQRTLFFQVRESGPGLSAVALTSEWFLQPDQVAFVLQGSTRMEIRTLNGHYLQQKLQSSPIKGQAVWTWRQRPVVPAAQET